MKRDLDGFEGLGGVAFVVVGGPVGGEDGVGLEDHLFEGYGFEGLLEFEQVVGDDLAGDVRAV